jgi:hypothetical protein
MSPRAPMARDGRRLAAAVRIMRLRLPRSKATNDKGLRHLCEVFVM